MNLTWSQYCCWWALHLFWKWFELLTQEKEKFLSLNLIQMFLFYRVYPPSPNHQHTHLERKEMLFTSTLLVSCLSPRQLWYTGLKNDNNKNHSTFCPVFAVLDVCELCVEQFTNAIEAGVPGTSLLPQPPCPFTSHPRPHPVPPHCWHWLMFMSVVIWQVTPSTQPPEARLTAVTTSPAQHPRVRSLVTEGLTARPAARSILPKGTSPHPLA